MFTPEKFRTRAAEYTALVKTASNADEAHEYRKLEQSFTVMADNEQWLTDHHDQTVRRGAFATSDRVELAAEEEQVLRCLGAALILQWNTLPAKLRRELFDNAGAMGELLDTRELRAQIARFLHKHKDDGEPVVSAATASA